jgi:LytR cell envelope-related transcriptional attenuator
MAPCMSSILALSVSDKIDQYGAYAGFASVLGLAVLSLLYFAQAREVKRLREWAGRSPERAAELQERAVAAAQQRAIVAPQRPATPVGAPAPAVAPGARPAAATPAGQAQGAPAAAPAAAAAATAAGAATAAPGAPAPAAPAGPGSPPSQPTTAMPAANGAAAPSPPAASPPVRPGQPLRVPGSTTTPPPGRLPEPDDDGGSRLAVFGAIGAIVVVAIVAVVLLTGALGGDDPKTQTPNTIGTPSADSNAGESPTKTTTGSSSTTPAAAPAPGTYTVAVLNGTTVPGLARGVANRLQNTKFKIGNVTNAATQDRSATLVEFAPGHRAEADAVAKAIEVGRDAIQPLSPGSKTIAGDQATVVVTVGSDQNTSPQAQTTP